jgi:hypothetical protein
MRLIVVVAWLVFLGWAIYASFGVALEVYGIGHKFNEIVVFPVNPLAKTFHQCSRDMTVTCQLLTAGNYSLFSMLAVTGLAAFWPKRST